MRAPGRIARGAALALALSSTAALAEVRMTAVPTLGPDVAPGGGWTVVAVRVENADPALVSGEVEVITEQSPAPFVRAPFSVAAGAAALLRVPVHADNAWQFTVRLRAASGKVLAEQPLRAGTPTDPVLVEVFDPPRLPAGLRGAKVPARYHPSYSSAATLPLSLGGVAFDAATGDPLLPTRAAEYGPTTALVIPSDVLSRVAGPELEALASWVLAGGTLAVAVKRPEDLRAPVMVALLGGEARDAGPARHLATASAPGLQKDASGAAPPTITTPLPPPPDAEDEEPPPPAPPPSPKAKPSVLPPVTIGRELGDALVSYAGGNLTPSDLGATAAYGLGEVHLLAFDPWRPGALDDAWVQSRMVELTRHAWDRRAAQVLDRGRQGAYASPGASDLRRLLDPNEGARWAIVLAALLLFAYAVVSGPVNFAIARNRGRPLSALVALPLMSLGAFLLIVLLGVVSRGVRGQARHLSLVEAGGGMTKGAVRRYRGFFTPSAKRLTVRATDTGAVIDVLSDSSSRPTGAELLVERGGLSLSNLATLPWQTVVAREDGTAALGGGVSLVRDGADVRVVNRSARALRGVLVSVPRRGVFHFSSIKDGGAVLGTTGALVLASPTTSYARGALATHPLSASTFESAWTRDGGERLARAWRAIEAVARPRQADWWPEDVPVLLAQADGGEGATSDAGLTLSEDRVLVRIVGWGGAP